MSIILGIIGEKKRSARKNNRKILEHNRIKPNAILFYDMRLIIIGCEIQTYYRVICGWGQAQSQQLRSIKPHSHKSNKERITGQSRNQKIETYKQVD